MIPCRPNKHTKHSSCVVGFINPGSLRTGFRTKARSKSLNTTGQRNGPATNWKVGPKKSNTRSSATSAHLSDRSSRFGLQPPPDGLSDRKACPEPYFRLRPHVSPTRVCKNPARRSSPTGTNQSRLGPSDRGCPLGRDQG